MFKNTTNNSVFSDEKLDRVYYGGLTKKDLPRGRYRHLTEREVIMLRHFS